MAVILSRPQCVKGWNGTGSWNLYLIEEMDLLTHWPLGDAAVTLIGNFQSHIFSIYGEITLRWKPEDIIGD